MEWVSDEDLDYLGQFGLEREPFNEYADGTAFFQDALITQRLGMLQHFSRYSDLMLLVTGEFGVGKSTLKRHFSAQLDDDIQVSQVIASSTMDRESLLLALGKGFGMPPILDGDQNAFIKQLKSLLGREEAGLLIIDDAHLLPTDTLLYVMELAEIRGQQDKLLRVLLFAEPRIEQLLAEPALARLGERISHSLDIPPMEMERCEAYIHHRLASAGYQGGELFSRGHIKKICKSSRGNPSRINELATELLLEMVNRPQDENAPIKRIYSVLILSVLLIAIASVLYFYRSEIFPQNTPGEEVSPDNRTVVLPLKGNNTTPPPRLKGWQDEQSGKAGQLPEPADPIEPARVDTKVEPVAPPTSFEHEQTQAKPLVAPLPEETSDGPRIEGVEPSPVVGSSRRQVITIHGSGFEIGAQVSVGWTGKAATLKPWQVKRKSASKIEFRVITGTQADTWTVRVKNPNNRGSNVLSFQVVPPKEPQKTVEVKNRTDKGAQSDAQMPVSDEWLAVRLPQHYTIQLLASRNANAVTDYVRKHQLEQAHQVEILKQGQRWHYLVVGDYSSRVEADTVAAELLGRIKGVQPWVRNMASLQQVMFQGQVRGSGWIRQQSDSAYSLQLVAGGVSATIQEFVGQHRLSGSAAIYETERNGKPWYVLIYGVYADQGQARAAVSQLPESVRQLKPWSRSYASIKAELK